MAPTPSGAVPPTLPPSVEEAYRRKCIQLKQRMNEVDEANDVARLRLVRMQRAIEKMRLERAFLLEQLAKRTSTSVEDSEGSPSPPPTPKEKPLRIKRGHRKPSFLNNNSDGRAGGTFIQQGPNALSPSSDAFSHNHLDMTATSNPATASNKRPLPSSTPTNGHTSGSPPSRRPKNAFELYCNDMRSVVQVKNRKELASGEVDMDGILAKGWRELDEENRAIFQKRFGDLRKQDDADKAEIVAAATAAAAGPQMLVFDGERRATIERDEDVEMADDAGEESGGGGFTAINRG